MRLELTRRNRHYPLKVACIPISPPAHCSAQNRTRTCTSLPTLVPETSASTNFAIWALSSIQIGEHRPLPAYIRKFRFPSMRATCSKASIPFTGKMYRRLFLNCGCKDNSFFIPERIFLKFISYLTVKRKQKKTGRMRADSSSPGHRFSVQTKKKENRSTRERPSDSQ